MAIISKIETIQGYSVMTGEIGGSHYVAVTYCNADVFFKRCESEDQAWSLYLSKVRHYREYFGIKAE